MGKGERSFTAGVTTVEISLETPQITQAIVTALDCLPELEGKSSLLKTGHTLSNGNVAVLEATSLKVSSQSTVQAAKGERQLTVRHQL